MSGRPLPPLWPWDEWPTPSLLLPFTPRWQMTRLPCESWLNNIDSSQWSLLSPLKSSGSSRGTLAHCWGERRLRGNGVLDQDGRLFLVPTKPDNAGPLMFSLSSSGEPLSRSEFSLLGENTAFLSDNLGALLVVCGVEVRKLGNSARKCSVRSVSESPADQAPMTGAYISAADHTDSLCEITLFPCES